MIKIEDMRLKILRTLRGVSYFILNNKYGLSIVATVYTFLSKYLEYIFKQDKRLVVFGCKNGLMYGDNSKLLFEYLVSHSNKVECCWLTNSLRVYKQLKVNKLPVALSWSLKGVRKLYQAKVGVYSNTLRDISFEPLFVPRRLKLVLLRHGKSVKRVVYAIKDFEKKEKPYRLLTFNKEYSQVAFTISTSPLVSNMTEECMRIGIDKHKATGYPRYDLMLKEFKANKDFTTTLNNKEYDHIILYAPTWRNGLKETKFFPFSDFNPKELIDILKINNAIIIIRPHVNDLIIFPKITKYLEELEVISKGKIFLDSHNQFPDLYELLPCITILFSDYSSIYHDFLLLNRPMFFIPYDYDWFNEQFGFLYNYREELPGGEIISAQSMMSHLKDVFDGKDIFKQKREELRDKLHTYKDSNSSQRVASEIENILDNSEIN